MNNHNFILFKRKRDLGTILSDTVKFLSVEWKPFLLTVLKAAIIPILLAIGGMIYYLMSFSNFFEGFINISDSESEFNFSEFVLPVLFFVFTYLIAYSLITVTALSYLKSYISNNGIVNFEEVNNYTKEKFWSFVGLFFLNGLIIVFGALFCFFPAIYLGVVLSLSSCILVFQNKSTTDAINDSFSFIKNYWWETFGVLLVVQILIGVVGFVVDLPASLYQVSIVGLNVGNEDPSEIINIFSDPLYVSLLVFSNFVKLVLYIITIVTSVFIYFDIKEQKNPSNDVINQIGIE